MSYKIAYLILYSRKIISVNQCTIKKPFNNYLLIPYFISYPTESFYYKIRDFLQNISYAFVAYLIKSSSMVSRMLCKINWSKSTNILLLRGRTNRTNNLDEASNKTHILLLVLTAPDVGVS